MSQLSAPARGPAGTARLAATAVGLVGVLTVLVLAFLWPAATSQPRGVRVAVTGPPAAVAALGGTLAGGGVFDVTPVPDRAAAVAAIESRDVVGGLVLGRAPEVLTASAAGTQLSQAMTALAGQAQEALQAQADAAAAATGRAAGRVAVTVTDVVPLSPDDARGIGFTVGMYPLVIGGILGGVGLWLAVAEPRRRGAAILVYAVAAGLALNAVMRSWFGILQGSWWAQAAAVALMLAAIAGPVAGLAARLGWPGVPVGSVLMLLLGNPLSGVTIPEQFLPDPWGAVGQWLPPGAGGSLLRDLSYFPSADATRPWLVLGAWALTGLALGLWQPAGPAVADPTPPSTVAVAGTPGVGAMVPVGQMIDAPSSDRLTTTSPPA